MPSVVVAATLNSVDVSASGTKLGELAVSSYSGEKLLYNGQVPAVDVNITANFTKDGIAPGGEALIETLAPQGLTYLQTLTLTTDKPQQLFRRADGGNLFGTFADPPQGGYLAADGTRQFTSDKTPWYSTVEPSQIAGSLPKTYSYADGVKAQFHDNPTLPFSGDYSNGLAGIANLLNGKDGSWSFETALVGVKDEPAYNPNALPDTRLTGTYDVTTFADFTWGLDFKYIGPTGKNVGFTSNDYAVTAKPLAFGSVSDTFKGAFDKKGDNADIEWKVNFVDAPVANVPAAIAPVVSVPPSAPAPSPSIVNMPAPTPPAPSSPAASPSIVNVPAPTPPPSAPTPSPSIVNVPAPTPAPTPPAPSSPAASPSMVNVPAPTPPAPSAPTPSPSIVNVPAPIAPVPNVPITNIPESSSVPSTLIAGVLGLIASHRKQRQIF